MIFRLGGLGILCVFAFVTLLNGYPLIAWACAMVYPILAIYLIRKNTKHPIEDSGPLEPWPPIRANRSFRHAAFGIIAILVIALALFLLGYFAKLPALFEIAAWFLVLFMGLGALFVAAMSMHHGYFPDTAKGRGVSRNADPLQFWTWVMILIGIGAYIIFMLFRSWIPN